MLQPNWISCCRSSGIIGGHLPQRVAVRIFQQLCQGRARGAQRNAGASPLPHGAPRRAGRVRPYLDFSGFISALEQCAWMHTVRRQGEQSLTARAGSHLAALMAIMATRGCRFREIRQFVRWVEHEAIDLLEEGVLEQDIDGGSKEEQTQQMRQHVENAPLLPPASRPGLFIEGDGDNLVLFPAFQRGTEHKEANNASAMSLKDRLSLVLASASPQGQVLRGFLSNSTAMPYTEFHRILLQAMPGVAEPAQLAEILLECDPLGEGMVFPEAVLGFLRPGAAKAVANSADSSIQKARSVDALGTYTDGDDW